MNLVQKLLKLVLLTTGCFILPVAQAALSVSNPLDRIVAVVNDDVITEQELNTQVITIKKQLRQQNTIFPADAVLKKQILERMILQRLQLQMADRAHIRVDDEMLNRTLDNIAVQNNLSLSGLQDELERQGTDFEFFREEMRKEIIISQLQKQHVHNRISVTKQEIDNLIQNQSVQGGDKNEYLIGHILIALPEAASSENISQQKEKAIAIVKDLRKGADFSQTAVAQSDGQQALEGGNLGWRRFEALPTIFAEWIRAKEVGDISDPIRSPSGFHVIKLLDKRADEKQYVVTQSHARHILIKTDEFTGSDEALIRIKKIKQRMESGESFEALAKAHSDDTGSAVEGGDLGWLNPGEVVPPFERALNELELNKISDPVRTQYGWHIIEVLGKRSHDNTEVIKRNKATEIIRARKTEPALQNWLRQLRDESFVENRL